MNNEEPATSPSAPFRDRELYGYHQLRLRTEEERGRKGERESVFRK